MPIAIVTVLFEYGPLALLSLVMIYISVMLFKIKAEHKEDKNLIIAEMEKVKEALMSKDIKCSLHKDYFKDTFNRLDVLETDTKVRVEEMKSVVSKVDEIGADVKKILHHFAGKGMG